MKRAIISSVRPHLILLFAAFSPATASAAAEDPVTPEDLARGWRLWEVRTNENASYAMPQGAALATSWWECGAYDDVVKVGLGDSEDARKLGGLCCADDGWAFPFGSNACKTAWAFTWGRMRFRMRDRATEIAAVGAPMSAVPGRSRLWAAVATNGARLVTWENFALGRLGRGESGGPSPGPEVPLPRAVNAQVELRPNGDFVTRSNGVETVYRRIDPEDWDGDGWRNEDDGDPLMW